MSKPPEVMALGKPLFADTELARVESAEGIDKAWQQAFRRDPLQAVNAAQGHFAVAARSESGRTVLAVDRFAVETMCFRDEGSDIVCAVDATALARNPSDIDPQALFDYLYFHAIPAPKTVFRGVKRLPAGHVAWHDGSRVQMRRYWAPTFDESPISFEAAKSKFRQLLGQAVKAQLDGSRPAAFLSGGTDSSTIAGMIREVTGQAPATYSIGFEAEGYDEMEYARLAARHFGTQHHEHYLTPVELARLIPLAAAHHDQPFGNSSALPAYFCALKAREDGVTRLLAGDGGDELFGGNTRYAKQRVFSWYQAVPGGLRTALLEPIASGTAFDSIPMLGKVASYVRQARVAMPDRLQTYNLLSRIDQTEMLTPAFLAQIDPTEPSRQERAVWDESAGASFVNRMLAFDWRYTLAESDLPKVRTSTALAGVSVGYPFLDQAIVEFSASLPTNFKLRHLKLRWFFKEALRGFLPDQIITKKKHGFGLPFGVWATRDETLKRLASDSLRGLGERGIVRREFIATLLNQRLPEHPGYFGELVWILMMLEQWFRHHSPDYRHER